MIWIYLLYGIVILTLIYIIITTLYLLCMAVSFFITKDPPDADSTKINRFILLVPAHNEELMIGRLCNSLLEIKYLRDHYDICIVADNCADQTIEICRSYPVQVLVRNDPLHGGKGFAINWALQQIPLDKYEAVFILDADNIVNPMILDALNHSLNRGEQAIQCYNTVGNRSDSWFTQILFVSRTVNNLLFHYAKYKLGLSSYLTGNGMCFSAVLLKEKGWTAFTPAEDWEYYAQLIHEKIKISFAVNAKVFHQESRTLNQATSQRFRWSSGKFYVFRTLGMKLFLKGIRDRDWFIIDASLPILFPNYSLLVNLTIITLIPCLLLPISWLQAVLSILCLFLIFSQFLLFLTGIFLSGQYWKVFKALVCVPLFLIWKLGIDFLSFTGIHRRDKWIRTERHKASNNFDEIK